MAKYTSATFSDLRGRLGGQVFARNRGGLYTRNFSSPVNPRSVPQVGARNTLEGQSIRWRSITSGQQILWNTLAGSVTWFDSLGNAYHPSGHQLFISCNVNCILSAQSTLDQPTSVYAPPAAPTIDSWAQPGADWVLTIDNSTLGDKYFIVSLSPPVSAGITFFRNSIFRLVVGGPFNNGANPIAIDLLAAYIAVFGAAPASGSRVCLKLSQVATVEGFRSTEVRAIQDVA